VEIVVDLVVVGKVVADMVLLDLAEAADKDVVVMVDRVAVDKVVADKDLVYYHVFHNHMESYVNHMTYLIL
jgi:hypothetical protein